MSSMLSFPMTACHSLTIEVAPGHCPRTIHRFMPTVTNPPPEVAERYRGAYLRSQ